MGYWTNSTYIRTGITDAVIGALIALFDSEGMHLISRPPERERAPDEPMQYAEASKNNLWAVAVFPCAPGWTVIKTAPLSLLGDRAPGAAQVRLVDLCGRLSAPGFHVTAYDSCAGVLAESDGEGNLHLSGYGADEDAPLEFYGECISEDHLDLHFDVLPLQHVIDAHTTVHGSYLMIDRQGMAEALAELLGGENARFCDNLVSVDTLIRHKPLLSAGGWDLYFERSPKDRCESAG